MPRIEMRQISNDPESAATREVLEKKRSIPAFLRETVAAVRCEMSSATARHPDLLAALVAAADIASVADGYEAQEWGRSHSPRVLVIVSEHEIAE